MIILIILIISVVKSVEICDRFTSHFDFYGCYENVELFCPNLGTWPCSEASCNAMITNGTCEGSAIGLVFPSCCTQKDIKYVDLWFIPQYEEESDDWVLQMYNLYVIVNGSNATLYYYVDEIDYAQSYDIGQDILEELTFVSIVIDEHNDTSCVADVYLYINGNLTIHHTGFVLEMYGSINILYPYIWIHHTSSSQKILFASAHIGVPSAEDIQWLYTLGPNRTADVEICYDEEDCPSCMIGVSSGYRTATVVLSIALGAFLFLLILLVIWLLYTYFIGKSSKNYTEMDEY